MLPGQDFHSLRELSVNDYSQGFTPRGKLPNNLGALALLSRQGNDSLTLFGKFYVFCTWTFIALYNLKRNGCSNLKLFKSNTAQIIRWKENIFCFSFSSYQ